ncbi:MAG TPA: PadR family transcriptional regulator [Candidatus Nanopelagicales bacterium]|nr:PadR family transcriptional regulator [Candidatus Nanopelagicales bacterium]
MKRHHQHGPRRGPQHPQHHPDFPGHDHRGHEHEDGPRSRGRGPHGGPGRRGRAPRGDVRAAILLLLGDEPMHGYQLMQAIGERSGGRWTPSPGAVYPAISQLEDEGLVTVTAESGRKLVSLTESGRTSAAEAVDPFAVFAGGEDRPDLRELLGQLHGATRQVGMNGTTAQVEAAATILRDARRAMYLLLADGPDA